MRLASFALLVVSILVIHHSAGLAQPPGPVWSPPEVLDAPVTDVSSSNGPCGAHTLPYGPWGSLDQWHVVYAKSGDIFHVVGGSGGWATPEPLTADPAASRDPKIAIEDALLHVAWEDDRTGHAEIWTRRWDGASWSSEECLTCDGVVSQRPSLAGGYGGSVLVWQEGPDASSSIRERRWTGSVWTPAETVSLSPQAAREPTVAIVQDEDIRHRVYWSDTRHGLPEIYGRELLWNGTFGSEIRLTDFAGSSRRPSARGLYCCGDFIFDQFLILFENDSDGTIETWSVCDDGYGGVSPPERISANDGIASVRPQVHGFSSSNLDDLLGGPGPHYLSTWTESGAPGSCSHVAASSFACPSDPDAETLSTAGYARSAIAASRDQPFADLLVLDVELRDGAPTLIARRGLARSCYDPAFHVPRSILLAPAGIPENLFFVEDECEGGTGHFEGMALELRFSSYLDANLTWDAAQPHPALPEQLTDPAGEARFPIRGGGCVTSGTVSLRANGVEVRQFIGARSPDVNGDCAVLVDDLAYVAGHVGGADPCADLDGSGLVDAADVAIVEATLGDLCSQLVGLGDPGAAAQMLEVMPNPCTSRVTFRIRASDPVPALLSIVDAGGRLVREFSAPAGDVPWDLRDASGRPVAPGIYFAVARLGAEASRRSIVVLP
jgi:hypothetical protein